MAVVEAVGDAEQGGEDDDLPSLVGTEQAPGKMAFPGEGPPVVAGHGADETAVAAGEGQSPLLEDHREGPRVVFLSSPRPADVVEEGGALKAQAIPLPQAVKPPEIVEKTQGQARHLLEMGHFVGYETRRRIEDGFEGIATGIVGSGAGRPQQAPP